MKKLLIAGVVALAMITSAQADVMCNDGWVSHSFGSGTCSHHRGEVDDGQYYGGGGSISKREAIGGGIALGVVAAIIIAKKIKEQHDATEAHAHGQPYCVNEFHLLQGGNVRKCY